MCMGIVIFVRRSLCRDQNLSGKKVGSIGQGLTLGLALALLLVHGFAYSL